MLDLWVKRHLDAMDVSSFQKLGRCGPTPAMTVTTMGPARVRPLLTPVEESAPVQDGERREEDESLQVPHEEAEEGRMPLFTKNENQPSSLEVKTEHLVARTFFSVLFVFRL